MILQALYLKSRASSLNKGLKWVWNILSISQTYQHYVVCYISQSFHVAIKFQKKKISGLKRMYVLLNEYKRISQVK